MTREELAKFDNSPVKGVGTVLQIIPAGEKSSTPKMLLGDVKIDGIDNTIHHMWVTPKKGTVTKKNKPAYFTGIVRKYDSIDKYGNKVEKYGVGYPRRISRDKNDVDKIYMSLTKKHTEDAS
jgi:hypothetical protein